MSKQPERGREMPPAYKHVLELSFHRKLSRKERLKLVAGFDLKLSLAIACEHKPGKFHPKLELELTKETDPKQA
jgi:hypothetical protein